MTPPHRHTQLGQLQREIQQLEGAPLDSELDDMLADKQGPLDALRAKVATLNNASVALTPAALNKKKRQKVSGWLGSILLRLPPTSYYFLLLLVSLARG